MLVAGIERSVADHIAAVFIAAGFAVIVQPSTVASPMICSPRANVADRRGAMKSIVSNRPDGKADMQALTMSETKQIGAGVSCRPVGAGMRALALWTRFAATGGMAGFAIGVIAGARTAGEIGLASVAVGLVSAASATLGRGPTR